ncbi:hypothetical protein PBI_POCKET_53 [Microbacterium phage Pocket]|uniref:Uncharacterized protein n=23 Tax=Ilzatvirus TaxID=2560150 RepID=A0A7T0M399_9CAUD|nr:hypothetical protein PBI_AUBERGINE_53 [Microbacterium phage Aubergine]AUX82765.1 hypothetical protein PBI_BAINES_53 [Microbacterium phage Baines]AUX82827.1 hypothetical protein PBI_ESPINOSA_53 [Microbacterium phage Espinosa]AUX82952.1 hypothetical protein PBI_KALE_53 [Microbacterium phage Kale]AUX83455.1 hypothetical protein PBI_TENDA_53 [Microbacterium phage Tenda]AVJ49255.1 hypothetical protein PBI_BONINO_53 [Microbacterium phage Bonino]AVO25231.1 hypothetical protein PBI_GELO_53 [Microb
MNNQRRKEIQEVISKLADLDALRNEIKEEIERIRDEEQEYYDNMPEGLQQSDRGYKAEEAASQLDDAAQQLDDLDIDGLTSNLDVAQE